MSNFLQQVKDLAETLHTNQQRVSGESYFMHLDRVAQKVSVCCDNNPVFVAAAYLHDCIEDGHITRENLEQILNTFSPPTPTCVRKIVFAVDRLTRKKGETYYAFIKRIIEMPAKRSEDYETINTARLVALLVKMCDLIDNIRSDSIQSRDDKYRFALDFLYKQYNVILAYHYIKCPEELYKILAIEPVRTIRYEHNH